MPEKMGSSPQETGANVGELEVTPENRAESCEATGKVGKTTKS